jgi:hypothetical protein
VLANKNEEVCDGSGFGAAKRVRMGDFETEISDGSGLAEAGVQPRRPQ